jgi:ubiquinone/menaquinone biosynthesis C-methylase UbiE
MDTVKAAVEAQFGRVAENYRTSTVHAGGEDLRRLVEAAALTGGERVLDAGTGAGHTALALAPLAAEVVALDLSAAMLAQGAAQAAERRLANLHFVAGDVEAPDFPPASLDRIVTRYSAHHWPQPGRALAAFRRLLKPGGFLLLADIVGFEAPVLDTHLQAIELLRDPSHVRDHTVAEWQAMLAAAGFACEVLYRWDLPLDFTSWTTRMATPPDAVAMLRRLLAAAPAEVQRGLAVAEDGSFVIPGALIRGWLP